MIEKSNNLSLVIPCYNEQDNLPLLFKKLLEIQSKYSDYKNELEKEIDPQKQRVELLERNNLDKDKKDMWDD